MSSTQSIRGSRIGSGPMGESIRGEAAPRVSVTYWCANGHETVADFAAEVADAVPDQWDCPRCGLPGGRDRENPPAPPRTEVYKTHLAYVKERRSETDGQALLDEALEALRERDIIR